MEVQRETLRESFGVAAPLELGGKRARRIAAANADTRALVRPRLLHGRCRRCPILMTRLCTLFGLLPLALGLGAGAELQKPPALAVIGGPAVSTAVTLLIRPGMYVALAGAGGGARRD